MLSLTRYALKLSDKLLPTTSLYSTASAKPTITKKKYSELPALRHHARHPYIPECVSFATPECMRLSVDMVLCFAAGISNSSSSLSQPLSPSDIHFGPIASTKRARRRHARRNDDAEDTSIPESTDPSNSTPHARKAAPRQKRSRKASPPTPTGESCEWQCTPTPECLNL
jgi:hypothetical protein